LRSPETLRLTIAHPHALFRDALRNLLNQEQDIRVTDEAPTEAPQVVEAVARTSPHVLIIDGDIATVEGTSTIGKVSARSPQTKTLVLVKECDQTALLGFLRNGAKGYLTERTTAVSLKRAIRAVHNGELWVERRMLAAFLQEDAERDGGDVTTRATNVLTPKEQEALSHLVLGCTNKEIAIALDISEKTVKCHLYSIFKKLQVRRRSEAVAFALTNTKHHGNGKWVSPAQGGLR
jgi:DNA-binding NarL/FixJ family response regulator